MTAPERLDLARTVLVVFDMQKGQFEGNDVQRQTWLRESNVLGNCAELIATARKAGIQVIYVRNTRRPDFADQFEVLTDAGGGARGGSVEGTRAWEIMDEIAP